MSVETLVPGADRETISPELVLVDPELARVERARLVEAARLESPVDLYALPRSVELQAGLPARAGPRASPWRDRLVWSRRRFVAVALVLTLSASGLLAARMVAGQHDNVNPQSTPLALRSSAKAAAERGAALRGSQNSGDSQRPRTNGAAPQAPRSRGSKPRTRGVDGGAAGGQGERRRKAVRTLGRSSRHSPSSAPRAAVGHHADRSGAKGRTLAPSIAQVLSAPSVSRRQRLAERTGRYATKADVERKIISLLIGAPSSKLPRRLVDARTGLVKNNVQAVCRRQRARRFLCVVRPASHTPGEGLYVRYRLGRRGPGVFTWYGYRTG